jgi:cardiolipin synthase
MASLRGVDVRLVVPAHGDVRLAALAARPFYRELIEDGVRVLEYQRRVLHAKAILVDDDLTLLGSVNLDERSMRLNFELLVCTLSTTLAKQLETIFVTDFEESRALAREDLAAESRWSQLVESLAHLLSPLL